MIMNFAFALLATNPFSTFLDNALAFFAGVFVLGIIVSFLPFKASVYISVAACVVGLVTAMGESSEIIYAFCAVVYIAMFFGDSFWRVQVDPDEYELDHYETDGDSITFFMRFKRSGGFIISSAISFVVGYVVTYFAHDFGMPYLALILPALFLLWDIYLIIRMSGKDVPLGGIFKWFGILCLVAAVGVGGYFAVGYFTDGSSCAAFSMGERINAEEMLTDFENSFYSTNWSYSYICRTTWRSQTEKFECYDDYECCYIASTTWDDKSGHWYFKQENGDYFAYKTVNGSSYRIIRDADYDLTSSELMERFDGVITASRLSSRINLYQDEISKATGIPNEFFTAYETTCKNDKYENHFIFTKYPDADHSFYYFHMDISRSDIPNDNEEASMLILSDAKTIDDFVIES